jgi:hypothetical protein
MQNRTKILGATLAAAALAGVGMATPVSAASRHHMMRGHHAMHGHHMMHHQTMRHSMHGRYMRRSMNTAGPRYVTGAAAPAMQYRQGYQPGYYNNGFNPITGVLGAAATIATAPLAIVTGGYPYGGYPTGAYYEPTYASPYAYGYGYEGPGWPKRGPYYNTW